MTEHHDEASGIFFSLDTDQGGGLGGVEASISCRMDVISMLQEGCKSAGGSAVFAGGVAVGGSFGYCLASNTSKKHSCFVIGCFESSITKEYLGYGLETTNM